MRTSPRPVRSVVRPIVRAVFLVLALVLGAACAARPAEARPLRDAAGPYELQVLVEGAPSRTFEHRGETWVLGHLGDRYTLRVINRSPRRIEAVVSVDGRDVIDGQAGDASRKRGYLVPAYGSVDIDGWRVSEAEAAAFRFSSVSRSYAARMGAPRDVGVIGVAVFPERERRLEVPRPPLGRAPCCGEPPRSGPGPSPSYDRGHAPAKSSEYGSDSAAGTAAPPPAASAPAPSRSDGEDARSAQELGGASDLRARRETRPGLGTEYGEAVASAVREVEFTRESPTRPATLLGARYNDRAGLLALGIVIDPPPVASDGELRRTADPFPGEPRRYAPPPAGWTR